jgi:fimbrial chaperone protein
LTVTPTGLNISGGGKVATISVSSKGSFPTVGQVRVLRWLQRGGEEKLVPTRDVAASPPALRLDPGKQMTVRLVRTAKNPVTAEECYRVLVDQLPGAEQDGNAVQFAVRHSIPLCFDGPRQKQAPVVWSVRRKGNSVVLSGSNDGERRVAARDVKITGAGGASASLGAATVLGGSAMSWPLKGNLKGFKPGSAFTLTATVNGKTVEFRGEVGGG